MGKRQLSPTTSQTLYDLVVVGSSMSDFIVHGISSMPKLAESVVAEGIERTLGGMGFNVAHGSAVLGNATALISKFGTDSASTAMRDHLERIGINPNLGPIWLPPKTKQPKCICLVDATTKERSFIAMPESGMEITIGDLTENEHIVMNSKSIHFADVGRIPAFEDAGLPNILKKFRARNPDCLISCDAIPVEELSHDDWISLTAAAFRCMTHILISDHELALLSRCSHFECSSKSKSKSTTGVSDWALDACEDLRDRLGLQNTNIVVKVSSHGAIIVNAANGHLQATQVPAIPISKNRIVDTVGAGDAWVAGFLSAAIKKKPLELCCKAGHVLAHFCLESRGGTEYKFERNRFHALLSS